MSRRAGVIQIQINGRVIDCAGDFDYNLGAPITEDLTGPSGNQGYSEKPQPATLEGAIRDASSLDLKNDLLLVRDATITLELANGKTVMFYNARWSAEGKVNTGNAEIEAKFSADNAEEIPA